MDDDDDDGGGLLEPDRTRRHNRVNGRRGNEENKTT